MAKTDIDIVAENLAELLTNTVDMASVFYDIFLNPNPMIVHLKAFDDDNRLIEVSIPNRAMDRITPYTGEGSPEGKVEAPIGSVYVDTMSSTVYYKVSGDADDPFGWNAVISQSLMETFIRTYLEARGYITTSSLRTYLITHEYVDVPYLNSYLTANGYIRSGNLNTVPEANLADKTILIDGDSEEVNGIAVGNLIASMISAQDGNSLTIGEDNKLFVDDGVTGVVAGTYVYPKNLVVNEGGRITSVEQGSQADITIATDVNYGIVRPDNSSIVVNEGVISSVTRNVGEIIASTLPLTDAGLHLLDGTLLSGSGSYAAFVNYIKGLYNANPNASYFAHGNTYNITTTGILTNASGVLSGFSTSNYATANAPFKPGNSSWSIDFKVKTGSDVATQQWVWCGDGGVYGAAEVYIESSKFVVNLSSEGSTGDIGKITGTNTLSVNTNYWVRLKYNGSNTYTLHYSTNGSTYTQIGSLTSSLKVYQGSFIEIGIDYNGETRKGPFLGTIDLNSCSFTIGSTVKWKGVSTTAEDAWQQSVAAYGVCGKFVYNSANNTVRLPKITGFVEGGASTSVVGDLVRAGLPNITGEIWGENKNVTAFWSTVKGCFYQTSTLNQPGLSQPTDNDNVSLGFDASNSNDIYGRSSTVQPQSIKVLYYIVIANVVKPDVLVDIDNIASDLNGKLDKDLTNASNQTKITLSSMGMPSSKRVNLTLGASGGEYLAPANGYFNLSKNGGSAGQYIYFSTSTLSVLSRCTASGAEATLLIPVRKGDKLKVSYTASGTTNFFRFIYAVGSESEAN